MIPDVAADAIACVFTAYELFFVMCACLGVLAMFPCVIDWLGGILGEGKD